MTGKIKSKRKHATEFDKALAWAREINDAFTDVDGLSGWHLVGVERLR